MDDNRLPNAWVGSIEIRDLLRRRRAEWNDNERRQERPRKRVERAYAMKQQRPRPYDPDRPGPPDPTSGGV